MKKNFFPLAFILIGFLILYSCSAEEEDTTPTPSMVATPEPEPEVSQFTLTVTAAEGGSVSTEGGTFDEGTEVTITATPDEGFLFSGWEGNSFTGQSLTITLNSNQSLSALFEQVQSDVIASSDGTTTDQDGNTFGWINYKSQDWAIKNAQVVTYRDGTPIPQVNADAEEWGFLTTGAWCYYDNDPTKGKLYNWYAVMGIHDNDPNTPNKEFAPEGWHVPSKEDWEVLRGNLTGLRYYTGGFGKCNSWVAKSMASTSGWVPDGNTDASIGVEQNLNNSSGFNALPTGYCDFDGFEGEFREEGKRALFWSSSSSNPNSLTDGASSAELYNYSPEFFISGKTKMFGLSVRFMRNLPKAPVPIADDTATDQDGNTFGWINYESQNWAIENAQVVTYRDGTPIPQVNADAEEWGFLTTGAWCYYDNDPTKGKLYNWYAVMGIHDNDPNTPNKEFAPEGWHLPSKEDWEALRDYLIRSHYNYDLSLCENRIAQSMASTIGWDSDINPIEVGYKGKPGYQQNLNNSSGFNALPTGYCDFDGFEGEFRDEGKRALFWSSSSSNPNSLTTGASSAELYYSNTEFFILGKTKMFGLSVRFIKD